MGASTKLKFIASQFDNFKDISYDESDANYKFKQNCQIKQLTLLTLFYLIWIRKPIQAYS